jgi:hypothetical protein
MGSRLVLILLVCSLIVAGCSSGEQAGTPTEKGGTELKMSPDAQPDTK